MIASLLKMTWVCKSPAYASSHASLRCRRILSGILLSWRKYSQVWKTTCQISQAYLHSVWKFHQNVSLIKSVKYLNFRAKMGQKPIQILWKTTRHCVCIYLWRHFSRPALIPNFFECDAEFPNLINERCPYRKACWSLFHTFDVHVHGP